MLVKFLKLTSIFSGNCYEGSTENLWRYLVTSWILSLLLSYGRQTPGALCGQLLPTIPDGNGKRDGTWSQPKWYFFSRQCGNEDLNAPDNNIKTCYSKVNTFYHLLYKTGIFCGWKIWIYCIRWSCFVNVSLMSVWSIYTYDDNCTFSISLLLCGFLDDNDRIWLFWT